jgi:DNA-binding NarL/FixJ family response regulator
MPKSKILIIEDQAPMRRNVALMLELEGYDTCTAENGRIGIEVAHREKPDLILCDVMMPELDGYGVVQALRVEDAFATTPFIFLTAKSDRSDILAAVQTRLATAAAIRGRLDEATNASFDPDFTSHEPIQTAFGLTPREAEVLLWVAQGKSNGDVAAILDMSEKTAKQHLGVCFQKMGVESRTAATLAAIEILAKRKA